jgi:hypothetical protein
VSSTSKKSPAPQKPQTSPPSITAAVSVSVVPIGAIPDQTTAPGVADWMIDTVPSLFPQFYAALGRGIAAWQHVEQSLFEVFNVVSTCRDKNIAAAIFYGNHDFSIKLALTHYAARLAVTDEELLEEWALIRKGLINGEERRNALAHFHTILEMPLKERVTTVLRKISHSGELLDKANPISAPPKIRLMLQPNSSDPNEAFKKHQKATKERMPIKELLKARAEFGHLKDRLTKFVAKLPAPKAQPKESPSQPPPTESSDHGHNQNP